MDRGGSGFFRVEVWCGRWWFVTPAGHPFYSAGVNTVTPWGSQDAVTGEHPYHDAVAASYADDAAWAGATVDRLRSWGFTTIGSWAQVELFAGWTPYTVNLDLSGDDWEAGTAADWWDPSWEAAVAASVTTNVAPRVGDPWLVGWFLDNEIKWGPDWRGAETLLQLYLAFPAEAPGKAVAVGFLLDQLGGVAGVNAALGTTFADEAAMLAAGEGWGALAPTATDVAPGLTEGFLALAGERYFSTTTAAIRAVDPDHLVLGNREVSVMTPAGVYAAQAPYVDVVSINSYRYVDGLEEVALQISGGVGRADGFAAAEALVARPILVTEFGFRAADSGLPNSWPPVYPTFDTQAERAAAFAEEARGWQAVPWVVGYHWFEWVDQPANGRFDGEDNNWGLVDVADAPYAELTGAAAAVNGEVAGYLEVEGG